jgi:hypothetical protein
MWDLLTLFTESRIKLMSCRKTGKWLRSSRLNQNDTNVKISRVQSENETIEQMADSLGFISPDNDWANISISNEIIEEDYTMDGGTLFTISFRNNFSINLDNIVDYFSGDNILGKDIYKVITFENNDLKTISGKSAIDQSFKIKTELKKNSIPQFPDLGVDGELIGSNVAAISYPSILRGLLNVFKLDQRFKEVSLIDIFRKDDALFIKFSAKSINKDSLVTNINV